MLYTSKNNETNDPFQNDLNKKVVSETILTSGLKKMSARLYETRTLPGTKTFQYGVLIKNLRKF